MFLRLLPAFAFLVGPTFVVPAFAETSLPCEVTPDNTSCSRIFACIGADGRWFQGRAIGRGTGKFDGKTDDGVACHGTWTNNNGDGAGQADMVCNDGMTAVVYYTLQDSYTGTGIGEGTSNTRQTIQSWTGEHVIEFFQRKSPGATALMQCGAHDILIS